MKKLDSAGKSVLRTIGLLLRQLRKKQRITQKDFAKKAKSHPTFISNMEHGKVNFSVTKLFKISIALELSILQFFASALKESKENSELLEKIKNQLRKLNKSQLEHIENYVETYINSPEK
jgi:transcriptional regulator with XRE-family HTH domain